MTFFTGTETQSRLGNVRDEYYDDSFSEDEYSLQVKFDERERENCSKYMCDCLRTCLCV